MSYAERDLRSEQWAGEERRRAHARAPRRSGVDVGMLAFASLLVLAELAWLGFLVYLGTKAVL